MKSEASEMSFAFRPGASLTGVSLPVVNMFRVPKACQDKAPSADPLDFNQLGVL